MTSVALANLGLASSTSANLASASLSLANLAAYQAVLWSASCPSPHSAHPTLQNAQPAGQYQSQVIHIYIYITPLHNDPKQ